MFLRRKFFEILKLTVKNSFNAYCNQIVMCGVKTILIKSFLSGTFSLVKLPEAVLWSPINAILNKFYG